MVQLLAVDLVAAYLVINWLCIKIASGVDKEFAVETEAKQVVLKVVVIVDWVDGVDESGGIDKYKGIALS